MGEGERHGGPAPPREGKSIMKITNVMLCSAQAGAWLLIGAVVLLFAR
ncbi:hypothetical protein [Microtetraspora niveoalba]|nr:hypothetical protein [Microtetraspora niveoalba]